MNRAKRYERLGRAKFIAPLVIRFLDTPMQASIANQAEVKLHASVTGQCGYDRVDRSFLKAARHIPVVMAEKMIREEKSSRNWSYSAAVTHRRRRDDTAAEVGQMRHVVG